MSSTKDKERKESLSAALSSNKRAPIWVYLKTKNRDLIRGRTRHWRSGKLGRHLRKRKHTAEMQKKGWN